MFVYLTQSDEGLPLEHPQKWRNHLLNNINPQLCIHTLLGTLGTSRKHKDHTHVTASKCSSRLTYLSPHDSPLDTKSKTFRPAEKNEGKPTYLYRLQGKKKFNCCLNLCGRSTESRVYEIIRSDMQLSSCCAFGFGMRKLLPFQTTLALSFIWWHATLYPLWTTQEQIILNVCS